MDRVGIFVNVSNQFYSVSQAHKGAKVDYAKYMAKCFGPRGGTLARAFAYGVQMKDESRDFIAYLRHAGYEPKYKQARQIDGRPSIAKTDWNMGLAMDVIRHLGKLDVVVIGSNDPDLVPLVQFIKERAVKVVIFSAKVGTELRSVADEVMEIDLDVLEQKECRT